MNYQQTIEFLYSALPMFSNVGISAFKKDLTNTIALCNYLGNPQKKFKTIHVAGTNGKGSVSHMLASILQTSGYKTGLYTSPHIHDFRERIKIDGQLADEDYVIQFVEQIKPVIEKIQPSFFEMTVAMAFDYFAKQQVDVAVIEVGLGGRLDSTNIILPELSIITNIGWDHMNLLGNTLEEIAGEKGGIIKQNTPIVIGEKMEQTSPIFKKIADEKSAPIYFAEDHFNVQNFKLLNTTLEATVENLQTKQVMHLTLDLPGIYQVKNLKTVLTAVEVLNMNGWQISNKAIAAALPKTKEKTGLHGRWEVVHLKPTVVLEVAHNEDGIIQMMAHLRQIKYRQLHLVLGMVKDKEAQKVLKHLPTEAVYYFTMANTPRALDAQQLHTTASDYNLAGEVFSDVNKALSKAVSKADVNDLIVVCGSIFLVAEVDKEKLAT